MKLKTSSPTFLKARAKTLSDDCNIWFQMRDQNKQSLDQSYEGKWGIINGTNTLESRAPRAILLWTGLAVPLAKGDPRCGLYSP